MKNKLIDLNNHMFEALERLNDDELAGEKLQQEIQRSQAMASVAKQIIGGASVALKAQVAMNEGFLTNNAPEMLGAKRIDG